MSDENSITDAEATVVEYGPEDTPWNQPYAAARLVDGRPFVMINPAVFTDKVSGETLAQQIAVAVNTMFDAQADYEATH